SQKNPMEKLKGDLLNMKKISLTKALLLSAASAAAAVLFTPKSGKEMRETLTNKGKKVKDKGQEKKDNLVKDMKDSYQEAEEEMSYYPADPVETDLAKPMDNDLQPQTDHVQSTAEKGEEWLDQVGEQQETLSEYPDASSTSPSGTFTDDTATLPAGGPEGVDFTGGGGI